MVEPFLFSKNEPVIQELSEVEKAMVAGGDPDGTIYSTPTGNTGTWYTPSAGGRGIHSDDP